MRGWIDSIPDNDYWRAHVNAALGHGILDLSKNLKIKVKTIILPAVLYGCEAWSLTLREECRLRVFENTGSCGEYLGPRG